MARQSNTNINTIGRSKITTPSLELNSDNGSVLISIARGEEIEFGWTFNWITGTTVLGTSPIMTIVEGNNAGSGIPTSPQDGGVRTDIVMTYTAGTDPQRYVAEIPRTLTDSWTNGPTPGVPVYGFFGIEVTDGEQLWKPVKGLVEIIYSATYTAP